MRQYLFCIHKNTERVDKLIVALFPTLSRSFVQHLIQEEHVLINQKVVHAHVIPRYKDIVSLTIPSLQTTGILPSDIPLEILYEDKDIIVINKQSGIVVHPTDNGGHISDSIVNALLFHRPKDFSSSTDKRPGIVHRLDMDTSGILLIAKNEEAIHYMSKQWHDRTVEKTYKTLVYGKITPSEGAIEAPVGRSVKNRKEMDVKVGESGRYALTTYKVLEYLPLCSLLEIKIHTGRTHQIRVHLKSIGFPVLGDATYGNKRNNAEFEKKYGLTRQFLHASKLRFKLPSTKKWQEIVAPLPPDLESVINAL